jgi:hypothetical protein
MIHFTCWKCNQPLSAPEEKIGQFVDCNSCGATCAVVKLAAAPTPAANQTPAAPANQTPVGRPPRKRKKLLIIGLVAFLLFAGAGVFLYWWFSRPVGLRPVLKYLPGDCFRIEARRPDKIRASAFYQRVIEENRKRGGSAEDQVFGIPYSRIRQVVLAVGMMDGKPDGITIVTMLEGIKPDDVKQRGKKGVMWKEEKVGKHTIYYHDRGTFCMPEDTIVLFASTKTLRKILERDQKPAFSERLAKLMNEADFSHAETTVTAHHKNGEGLLPYARTAGTKDLEGIVTHAEIGADMSMKAIAFYNDPSAARAALIELTDAFERLKAGRPDYKRLVERNELSFSQSGNQVTMTAKIKADHVIEDMRKNEQRKKQPPKQNR